MPFTQIDFVAMADQATVRGKFQVLLAAISLLVTGAGSMQGLAQEAANATSPESWPLFRGTPSCQGVAGSDVPNQLEVVWRYKVPQGSFSATAVIDEGRVFLGDFDGNVYALDLASGNEVWKKPVGSGFLAAGAVRNGRFFVGDMDGRVFCLDTQSGNVLWQFETDGEINSSPNFIGDRVLVGSQDAHLYCFEEATGDIVWKHGINDLIQCSPCLAGKHAFLAGCDGQLHVIDVEQGTMLRQVNIQAQTRATPAVLGDLVVVPTYRDTVFGIRWEAGKIAWEYQNPRRRMPFHSAPALTEKVAVFGGEDKSIHAVDLATGEEKWVFPTKRSVESSPVVVGNRVFVGSGDGRVYGLALDDGALLWSYDAGGSFTASPAVAQGRLVIANDDGTIYCFGGGA